MSTLKQCTKCENSKPFDEFHKDSGRSDGRKSICKACLNAHARSYHQEKSRDPEYRERARKKSRDHYWQDPESRRKASKRWREKNPERFKEGLRIWYAGNKHRVSEYGKHRYANNKEAIDQQNAEWRRANPEKARRISIDWYHRNKNREDVAARLAVRRILSDFLVRSGQSKAGRTHKVLGYSFERLKARMELQFQPGMSWDNHGEWHIDHKIPVSHFIAKGETRPHIVNALSNLQPLWAKDNLSKHCRWARQPARNDTLTR